MKRINNLSDLLYQELKEIYGMELFLSRQFPKLIDQIAYSELKNVLIAYQDEMKYRINTIEKSFDLLGQIPVSQPLDVVEELLDKSFSTVRRCLGEKVTCAGIILNIQCLIHFKFAMYGTAREFSRELQLGALADLLDSCLEQEKKVNAKLTMIAKGSINSKAKSQFNEAWP